MATVSQTGNAAAAAAAQLTKAVSGPNVVDGEEDEDDDSEEDDGVEEFMDTAETASELASEPSIDGDAGTLAGALYLNSKSLTTLHKLNGNLWSSTIACRRDGSSALRTKLQQSGGPLGRSIVHAQGTASNLRVAMEELQQLIDWDPKERVRGFAGGAAQREGGDGT